MDNKQIPIDSDKPIFIKATPSNMLEIMKKRIEERTNSLNAKHRQLQNPPQFKTMTEALTKLPNGGIVVGKLTPEEIEAAQTGNDVLLRKAALLREKARKMVKSKGREGTSYQALSKLQGRLPQSPYQNRDGYLEY